MHRLEAMQRGVTEPFKPPNMYEATTVLKKIYMNPVSNIVKVKLHQRKPLKRSINSCDPSCGRSQQESVIHKAATTYYPPPNQRIITSAHTRISNRNEEINCVHEFPLVKLPTIPNKSSKGIKNTEAKPTLIARPERVQSSKLKKEPNESKVRTKAAGNLPCTGTLLPMESVQSKSSFDFPFPLEALGPIISPSKLQEHQRRESARMTLFEYGTSGRNKLVFDVFENSPHQSGYGYEKFLNYNTECFRIDSSFANYGQVCAGKGAPLKPHPGKINCYEPVLRPFYRLFSPTDTTLVFESRFESGNLRRAMQV